MMCCSCEDAKTNTVVVVAERVGGENEVEVDDGMQREAEAEAKRKADEDAAAAAAAEEARLTEAGKKIEAEEAARQKKEAEDAQRASEAEEARKRKEAEDRAAALAAPPKEAEPENPPPQIAGGLLLTFRDARVGNTYTANFTTKPLGMDFNHNETPVKVTKAFGAAQRLGVSEGSCLINIAGTDVEKLGFADMLVVLQGKIAPLVPDGLVIDFKDPSGQLKPIVFPTKPLGMDFDNGLKPIKIKGVQGIAKSLGVQVGWVLANINAKNVEQMEFDQMLVLLRAEIESLPKRD